MSFAGNKLVFRGQQRSTHQFAAARNLTVTLKGNVMLQPEILLSPLKPAIPAQGGTLDIVVRVQAPDQPADQAAKVTPKRLALVVDRSGSMDGEPLQEALKCVAYIAGRMTPADQLALVVYDSEVDTKLTLRQTPSAARVEQTINGIRSGGSTNLFGGWEEGARQLEGGVPGTISRVLLLSDGQLNCGLKDEEAIAQHCSDWLAKGISTTTVGLGRGFNEDLMIAMARAGGGQQYYGRSAKDLHDSFDEEFSLLQALYLRQLDIKLVPAQGVIVEPIGLVQHNSDGSYRLSDLAWGAEAWIALRLHISPSAAGSQRDLLAVSLQANNLEGQTINAHAGPLSLPVLTQQAIDALPAETAIEQRLLEAEFAQATQASLDLVKRGEIEAALALLTSLEARFAHHPWLRDKLISLRELTISDRDMMMKEVQFSSVKMSRRLVAKEDIQYSKSETESLMPAFLRRKVEEGKGRKRE